MSKLKLEIERLEVESFDVTPHSASLEGTVFGLMPGTGPLINDPASTDCAGGATGPSNPVCIGPTYCCNPTANTTCCPALTWQESCAPTCPRTCDRYECDAGS